jgi:hypothetical protein
LDVSDERLKSLDRKDEEHGDSGSPCRNPQQWKNVVPSWALMRTADDDDMKRLCIHEIHLSRNHLFLMRLIK